MNDTPVVSNYIVKKIKNKLHPSVFAGAPHGKTTTFIIQYSKHNYNFDVLQRFEGAHFHIIDILDVTPRILNDNNFYLMCSGAHYGFHSCVLKLMKSAPITEVGWPCHFQNYIYYNQPTLKGWWDTIDFAGKFDIDDDE